METNNTGNKETNNNETYGVFLLRAQPLHIAHMWLIEKALQENKRLCIVLGSENKRDMLRNPFPIELRQQMLEESLQNRADIHRITLFTLPDWSTETNRDERDLHRWGHYLYYNIVARMQNKHFKIYYSDDPAILESWFDDEVKEFITLRCFERQEIFEGLSATKIRKAILENDSIYLEKYLPSGMVKLVPKLKEILEVVMENPKADFSMK